MPALGEKDLAAFLVDREVTGLDHALARALASGIGEGEAALIVGMTGSTVSILKMDPSFRELVAFYQADVDRAFTSMHNTLAALSQDAAEVLRERLEEDPDDISPNQLIELVKLGADRTGFGPKSTQDVNVNVGLAARMQEARERVAARKMIDITPEIKDGV